MTINNGAPAREVTTPTGNSVEPRAFLEIVSAQSIMRAPPAIALGSNFLCNGPTTNRIMWGTIKPTNPMIPQNDTIAEVATLDKANKMILTFFKGRPTDIADPSSSNRISISLLNDMIRPVLATEMIPMIANLFHVEVANEPKDHWMMLCN